MKSLPLLEICQSEANFGELDADGRLFRDWRGGIRWIFDCKLQKGSKGGVERMLDKVNSLMKYRFREAFAR